MCKILAEKLDQFYTKQNISNYCCEKLNEMFSSIINFNNEYFLEPSAGTGSFIEAIQNVFGNLSNIDAFDIDPKHKIIKKADFLKETLTKQYITIGNPPFGKRSSLAIDFFNKAALNSKIIAFIVPLQFDKYSVQKHLDERFKLIYSETLPIDSFIYNNNSYSVRCCFQIWTILETKYENMRICSQPEISHPDFEMFQYNNTKESIKYFNKEKYKWDFAVYRQGFYDYSERIEDEDKLIKNVQYIFFKAKTKEIKEILYNLDFEKLSQRNTTIPGFGKADVVKYYKEVTNK